MGKESSARSSRRPLAVVSGGGSGIGRAVARELAERGYELALIGRQTGPMRDLLQTAGAKGEAYRCDVRDSQAVATVARTIDERWGAADVVVPAAGIATIAPLVETDPAAFAAVLETNLSGCFHLFHSFLPAMIERRRGHLLALVSVAGAVGFSGWSAYCASKWGLAGLIAALRPELVDTGVRLTAIYPGATRTGIWNSLPGDWNRDRMIPVEEVVRAVIFALEGGSGTTISEIHLDPVGGPL